MKLKKKQQRDRVGDTRERREAKQEEHKGDEEMKRSRVEQNYMGWEQERGTNVFATIDRMCEGLPLQITMVTAKRE